MTKLIVVETCGDCGKFRWSIYGTPEHLCTNPKRESKVFGVDPNQPPPEGCPLLGLDAVLDKAKAANPFTPGYFPEKYASVAWDEGVDAVRKVLEGGGE